ncbi:MAG: TonB family protein [Gemmatimonadaceae bacterium]
MSGWMSAEMIGGMRASISAGRCLTVCAGVLAALLAGCHQPKRSAPMASFPAHASLECYVPGPEDYALTIVVNDTAFRDSSWLRPMLNGIGQNWPVTLPLPKRALDVGFTFRRDGSVSKPRITRPSGSTSFDDRALRAVLAALTDTSRRLPDRFGGDSLDLLVRFGSTNFKGAMVQTWYSVARPPRPRRGNPEPDYPRERRKGQQVIAAFTVDSVGNVDPSSIEIVSSTDDDFANAVVNVLPRWRFTPSTVRGCRVARSIRWEFGDAP